MRNLRKENHLRNSQRKLKKQLAQPKKNQKKSSRSKIDSLIFLVGQDNSPNRIQITLSTNKSIQASSLELYSNRRMRTKRKYKTRVRKTIK